MILKEDVWIDDDIFKFVEENINLIEENKFTELYKKIIRSNLKFKLNQLAFMLLTSNINPLNYMSEIPYGFISYLDDIDKLIIPNTIIKIGMSAITNMYNLKSLYIPDSVKDIDSYAFDNCGLIKVSLPSTLEHIDRYVFQRCDLLEEIEYRGTIEQWKNLRKNPGWKAKSNIKRVKCIDGSTK